MSCGCGCGEATACNLIDSLKDCFDSILCIPDSLGLNLKDVSIVNRLWDGEQVGEGNAHDTAERVLPSPMIVDLTHKYNIKEGGLVQQGDILLKNISKTVYPEKNQIDNTTNDLNHERFYMIGDDLYKIISVKENYLTWDVHVRRLSAQMRYL